MALKASLFALHTVVVGSLVISLGTHPDKKTLSAPLIAAAGKRGKSQLLLLARFLLPCLGQESWLLPMFVLATDRHHLSS